MSGRPVDRRALLTGAAAALVGAGAVGRVLLRPPQRSGGPSPAPSATSRGLGGPGSGPTVAASPSPAPAAGPSPGPAPAPVVLPVLCRDAWGATPAGDGLVPHEPARITLHHTAVPLTDDRLAPARLRQHQHHHRQRGWADIAYHRGVDRRGNVYELRPIGAQGDTATDYDPAAHLLFLAEGDFDRQSPTDAQLEALARLIAWARTELGIPAGTVSGHRDHAATACPGDALHVRIPALRRRADELVAAGGVTTRAVCGDEGRAAVAAIEG